MEKTVMISLNPYIRMRKLELLDRLIYAGFSGFIIGVIFACVVMEVTR